MASTNPSMFSNPVLKWVDARFPMTGMIKEHLTEYYAPRNFNFWYYFGSLALLVLVLQIVRALSATRAAMDAPAGRVPFKPNGAAAKNPGVFVPFAGPSGTSGKGPLKPVPSPQDKFL